MHSFHFITYFTDQNSEMAQSETLSRSSQRFQLKKTFDQPKHIHNSGLQPNPKPNPTQPIQEIIFESLYLSSDLIESNQT